MGCFGFVHNGTMQVKSVLIGLGAAAFFALSYQNYGWAGVAVAGGAVVMWLLLQWTRVMHVLKRASQRPVGYVDSAVMLNARLRKGLALWQVVSMAQALGLATTEPNAQPEGFSWTDNAHNRVQAVFLNGKLQSWQLVRGANL
jgi:hypothetical protein